VSEGNFGEFIDRIRAGDQRAAQELTVRYEPVIRREVKMRLRDPRLFSQVEWTDVCQSVMASFFARAATGQYDLHHRDQLVRLLVVMTRHKLSKQCRRQRADRRDYRRLEAGADRILDGRPGEQASPSRIVAGRELLEVFRRQLSQEERQIADLRGQGCDWAEIAAQLGGSAEARRKQLSRALDRIERTLEESASADD
jgi:RNA polymerase sigma factor (sigma-70 family)